MKLIKLSVVNMNQKMIAKHEGVLFNIKYPDKIIPVLVIP